jgi:hypothetical protein
VAEMAPQEGRNFPVQQELKDKKNKIGEKTAL